MNARSWISFGLLALAFANGAALSQGGPPAATGTSGYGMMGGGYGPGIMGGPGMGGGPGMMGRPGMMDGPGMMGRYPQLDLTDDQRQKLSALGEQARRKTWDTMGQLQSEQYRLRELLRADPVNVSAVVDQQVKVDDLRRQILKARIETRNEMASILSPEQRNRLRDMGPWWYRYDAVE